ncbi:MAG TPA: efflux RND transporter periplasmic adaptor subunit [Planctomycetaceae bacterium]
MHRTASHCLLVLVVVGMMASAGCGRRPPQVAPHEAPTLPVSKPAQREITDYVDFTGRTDAVKAVDIRPRVTGYLLQMPFKEGSEVKAGDLLFEIDPSPYQAQLVQAQSQVTLNEAALKLAQTNFERAQLLMKEKAISQQEFDQNKATVEEAQARIEASKASLDLYKLNLAFSKVTSPIDGQISRYYLTNGNLVNQDQTLLTTVVSLDPMYVYFDMDEPTLLRIRHAVNSGAIKLTADKKFPVLMGLQGEEGFPHHGTIDFVNNQVNSATGSIAVRGVFENPKPEGGTRLLSPGMFVRVRLPIGEPHSALLVIDRAIASDQGLKFVYVVDKDHKVQYRRVTIGALQQDGLREIAKGLKENDWVLVGGLQQVRPQLEIQSEERDMPNLDQPTASPATDAPDQKSGDQQPSNEKSGDQNPGDPQPSGQKSGDQKSSG